MASSESHYQYGPDTYLLQLRDVDFPVRLRQYMKVRCRVSTLAFYGKPNEFLIYFNIQVASTRSPSYAFRAQETDFALPMIHERRRFTDIMDEEIDDEARRARRNFLRNSNDSGPLQYYHPNRRLKHELGVRDEAHTEADAILEVNRKGQVPFFRIKPKTVAMVENQAAQFSCLAVGEPTPSVQWFKGDVLLLPDRRISITHNTTTGVSILKIDPAHIYDCGIYKVCCSLRISNIK